MSKMARNKGQRGEREVLSILQPVVNQVYEERELTPPELKRNLMQTRDGGFDIVGLEWLALEVKFVEQQNLSRMTDWWKQTLDQAGPGQLPVLFYRKSRQEWRVRMKGSLSPVVSNVCVDVRVEDFVDWFKFRLRLALSKQDL